MGKKIVNKAVEPVLEKELAVAYPVDPNDTYLALAEPLPDDPWEAEKVRARRIEANQKDFAEKLAAMKADGDAYKKDMTEKYGDIEKLLQQETDSAGKETAAVKEDKAEVRRIVRENEKLRKKALKLKAKEEKAANHNAKHYR